jgi:hypothetical protein
MKDKYTWFALYDSYNFRLMLANSTLYAIIPAISCSPKIRTGGPSVRGAESRLIVLRLEVGQRKEQRLLPERRGHFSWLRKTRRATGTLVGLSFSDGEKEYRLSFAVL